MSAPLPCILDAGAMIAYLQAEPGDSVIAALLADTTQTCYAHAINMAEVYYHFLRAFDQTRAEQAIQDLEADGVIIRDDMDVPFWKEIGQL